MLPEAHHHFSQLLPIFEMQRVQ